MRRSRPPSRREVARFAKTRASQMRNFSTGRPDSIPVLVTSQLMDGRCICKRDNWPHSIIARVVPAGAIIPTPQRMDLFFETGDKNLGFLFWPYSEPGLNGPGVAEALLELTSQWRTHLADFQRSNSWTAPSSFRIASAVSGGPWKTDTDAVRYEVGVESGGTVAGPYSSYGNALEVWTSPFSPFTGLWEAWVGNALNDAMIPYYSAEIKSLCRVGGYLYVEVLVWVDEDFEVQEIYAAKYNASNDYFAPDFIWIVKMPDVAPDGAILKRMEGTDLIVATVQDGEDTVERLVCCLLDDGETGQVYVYHVSAASGGDGVGGLIDFGGYEADTYQANELMPGIPLGDKRPVLFAKGSLIWISIAFAVGCISINIDSVGMLWDTNDDTDEEGFPTRTIAIGVMGDRLMCAYLERATFETITDRLRQSGPDDSFGEELSTDRIEVARGHSRTSGIVALDGATGAVLGRSVFDDVPVEVDPLSGTLRQTLYNHPTLVWSPPALGYYSKPGGGYELRDDSRFYPSQFEFLYLARFHDYFYRGGVYPTAQSGDVDDNPAVAAWLTAGGGAGSYEDIPPNSGSIATMEARVDAYKEDHLRGMMDGIAAARTQPDIQTVAYDYLKIEHTARLYVEDTGSGGDRTLVSKELSWSNVKAGRVAGGAPADDEVVTPKMFWNFGRPNPLVPNFGRDPRIARDREDMFFDYDTWVDYDEFREDPDQFVGLYSVNGDDYKYLQRNRWEMPPGGASITVTRKFLLSALPDERYPRQASPLPTVRLTPSCNAGTVLVVGPHSAETYNEDTEESAWNPLKWAGYNRNAAHLWSYTLAGTGGATYCNAGAPIALADGLVYTFIQIDTTFQCVVLDAATGTLAAIVDEFDSTVSNPLTITATLLEAMFAESKFIADNGGPTFGNT